MNLNQTWAIVGGIGAGKTSFAQMLRGQLGLQSGTIDWPILKQRAGATYPSEVVKTLGFQEKSRRFDYGKHYYQERFHFSDPHDDITVATFLKQGLPDDSANDFEHWTATLGLMELLDRSFLTLSNGQGRRCRLVRAILEQPELLILDEPFIGLDSAARDEVSRLLQTLIVNGQRLLILTKPEQVPEWVTDIYTLKTPTFSVPTNGRASSFDKNRPTVGRDAQHQSNDPIITLHNVTVRYGSNAILDQLNWTVQRGERWAVLGPNGSGKTTLLSLLCGDHPQAFSNDITLFGHKRGSGETIWDVKRKVGLLSPELHLYFNERLTAYRAAATGFADNMVAPKITAEQQATLNRYFDEFGITHLAERSFQQLSTGEQRQVLLVRALVKEPELLILDEPFQAFDAAAITHAKHWLDTQLRPDQTLLFVSHYAEEIPESVTQTLRLR